MVLKSMAIVLIFWSSSIAIAEGDRPFNFSVYGNFSQMMREGDVSGKIALASIPSGAGVYGVGALADLQGEILIWDGQILVSPGASISGSTQSPQADDQAALLVTAQVSEWEPIQTPGNMTQQAFEAFVVDSARTKGIDVNKPFPFLVIGEITDYAWHVVTGVAKRHGAGAHHPHSHANKRTFTRAKAQGKLVGFYSAQELEAVISHPGERLHVHYTDDDLKISGHLDYFGIHQGATLLLPKQ